MGILNVTPDSFSDGGRWARTDLAVARGRQMVAEGADIVDVGGESTRPRAEPVSTAEEMRRVIPVIEALADQVRVSVDTRNAAVAETAVAAGATLINDVSACLWPTAAAGGVGWVAMHMQGEPATMHESPHYDDVVAEVSAFLAARAAEARNHGVAEVWVDPGIGFGKSPAHNLALLAHLDVLTAGAHPVMVGTSRKSFLAALVGEVPPLEAHDRLEPSLATAIFALSRGAAMVRVHDVAATVAAVRLMGDS